MSRFSRRLGPALIILFASGTAAGQASFIRGDGNGDGSVDLADAIFALAYLFQQGQASCTDALDVNDDGQGNIGDPISLLAYLFTAGTPPSPPFSGCGPDPTTDTLDCLGPVPACPALPPATGPLYPGRPFPIGNGIQFFVTADLDGDGNVDVLGKCNGSSSCAAGASGSLAVLFGAPDGVFSAPECYGLSSDFTSMAVGDVNADTFPDVIAGRSGEIRVLFGTGSGTLIPAAAVYSTLTFGTSTALDLGDLDGDGDLDCVATTLFTMTVLLNHGDGSFPFQAITSVGGRTADLGDLDMDGVLDLVVASSTNIRVMLGLGDGTFSPPVEYLFTGAITDVVLVDLDADSHLDVVATADGSGQSFLRVHLGSATAALLPPSYYPTPPQPMSLCLGDLDSDGHLEALVTLAPGSHRVCVLPGTPGGGFGPATEYFPGTNPVGAVFVDVNQDQDLDCVVGLAGGTASAVVVLYGSGTTSFVPEFQIPLTFTSARTAIGDLDADGDLDIVGSLPGSSPPQVTILVNSGTGDFSPGMVAGPGTNGSALAPITLADFNGDSDPDIAMATNTGITVFTGSTGTTFLYQLQLSLGFASTLQAADVNLDGASDIVATWSGQIVVYLGNGDATFSPAAYYGVGLPTDDLAFGDVDEDGDLDVVTVGFPAMYSVLLNNGLGEFNFQGVFPAPAGVSSLQLGDLDFDGDLDMITASGGVHVYMGTGSGLFMLSATSPGAGTQVVLADLDGDGASDVLTRAFGSGTGSGSVGVLLGFGDGTFDTGTAYSTLAPDGHLSVGDVDNDGDIDVIKTWTGGVNVLLNLSQ